MTQAGVGASPGYTAIDVRRMASDFELGEGVMTYGSFLVQQRGAGANMSVDISMDDLAYIRGDAVSLQSIYPVPPHSATINETVTAADGTNPRIDRVILELKDTTHDASGSNLVQTRIVAGTPTGGATLDNLTGAAAVPNSAMLLADVLVPALSTSVTNANIRDRRTFVTGVPPLFTRVDMVPMLPVFGLQVASDQVPNSSNNQVAAAFVLPRRIVGATRIRWKYQQPSGTAATGNYVIAIYDSTGRLIRDTGAVAFTGATSSVQVRSETITATTFEAGVYYVLIGIGTAIATMPSTPGVYKSRAYAANLGITSISGGSTAQSNLVNIGAADSSSDALTVTTVVPLIALSVG